MVVEYGISQAAQQWGDARKTLTLFRQAGETATERGLTEVTTDCIDANLEATERELLVENLLELPFNHFFVLVGIAGRRERPSGEIVQPVTTIEVYDVLHSDALAPAYRLSERAIRGIVTDLETMGLVETWVESKGREGRVKQIETTFDPQWVRDAAEPYLETMDERPEEVLLDESETA